MYVSCTNLMNIIAIIARVSVDEVGNGMWLDVFITLEDA